MRDTETGLTPKQAATDIAAGWILAAAKKSTGDVDKYPSERFQVEVVKHLKKMHNRLANTQAGLEAGLFEVDL